VNAGLFYAITHLYSELQGGLFNERATATETDAYHHWNLKYMQARDVMKKLVEQRTEEFIRRVNDEERPFLWCKAKVRNLPGLPDFPEQSFVKVVGVQAPDASFPGALFVSEKGEWYSEALLSEIRFIDEPPEVTRESEHGTGEWAQPVPVQSGTIDTRDMEQIDGRAIRNGASVNAARNAFQAHAEEKAQPGEDIAAAAAPLVAQHTPGTQAAFRVDVWDGNAARSLLKLMKKEAVYPITGRYIFDGNKLYAPAEVQGMDGDNCPPIISYTEAIKRLFEATDTLSHSDKVDVKLGEVEYRRPTKWDVGKHGIDGNGEEVQVVGHAVRYFTQFFIVTTRYGANTWLKPCDVRILVDEADREWQFKCKMLEIIAESAGTLEGNNRCFQAPFADEVSGRVYSLRLDWLNREEMGKAA
jgi:hypothetical protein